MNTFWDRILFRIFAAILEEDHLRRDQVQHLYETAWRFGLISTKSLNELSLLLAILVCPPGCSAHDESAVELIDRGLNPVHQTSALLAALAPRFSGIHSLGHFGAPRQSIVAENFLHTLLVPSLTRFHARIALVDYSLALPHVELLFNSAFRTINPLDVVEDRFQSHLCQCILNQGWPIAREWPANLPGWEEGLCSEERAFLDCALGLSPALRFFLHLSFYGDFNIRQIAYGTCPTAPQTHIPVVASFLVQAWDQVLSQQSSAVCEPMNDDVDATDKLSLCLSSRRPFANP